MVAGHAIRLHLTEKGLKMYAPNQLNPAVGTGRGVFSGADPYMPLGLIVARHTAIAVAAPATAIKI
jgi:hypothetical protein